MDASPPFTPQQAAAITARGFSVALSAGAGCGKTFVLTQRFLSHLDPQGSPESLSSLVAITFTDKAAREMRDRIRSACQSRLAACDPAEAPYWLSMLRQLDAARISTIHAFCSGFLRAFAVEAGLDPGFAVLEPPLAETLLSQATQQVVQDELIVGNEDALSLVVRYGYERLPQLLGQLTKQRFRLDWSAFTGITPETLAERWTTAWTTEARQQLVAQFLSEATVLRTRELLRAHTPSNPTMQDRRTDLLMRLSEKDTNWSDPVSQLESIREAARVQGGGGKSAWANEDIFEAIKETLTDLRKECEGFVETLKYNPEDVSVAALVACQALRLAAAANNAYDVAKQQAGALDFDDLLLKTRDVLRDRPDVCERFASGLRLLMVDEVQDTDPVQAEIIRSLCGAALKRGRLFLVGDFKQSIYRFRRADPGVFRGLREELPKQGRLSLTRNFRSQPEILRFVNLLFRPVFGAEYDDLIPANPEQLSPRPTIEFLWATTDAPGTEAAHKPKLSVEDLRAREADWMARRIRELLADDTPRVRTKAAKPGDPKLRRVESGDIVILFRALTNVALYESALRRYGVDYYLVGGKAFFAQQEIFDLLNLCRCLDDPDDAIALIGVLRSPLFGCTDDALHALSDQPGDWWSRLAAQPPAHLPPDQRERLRFAHQVLTDLRRRKDREPIAKLLADAIAATGYDAALLAEHLGRRKVANLRKLIDQAAAFDDGESFTLKDFVQRLQADVFDETDEEFATTLPETGGVVRLMSVHQAKGLEFPVVIVADVNREKRSHHDAAALHPLWGALLRLPDEFGTPRENLGLKLLKLEEDAADAKESLRLFYVAVTRAADQLILSTGIEPDLVPKSPWLNLLAERFKLDEGLLKGDALLGTMAGAKSRDEIPEIRVHRQPSESSPVKQSREETPLKQLVESVLSAEPQSLPASAAVFPVDPAALETFSVSQLEEVAARLGLLTVDGLSSPVRAVSKAIESATPPPISRGVLAADAFGRLVHGVLERADFQRLDQAAALISQVARLLDVRLDEADEQGVQSLLQQLHAASVLDPLRTAQRLHREVEFWMPWPLGSRESLLPAVISGQIDVLAQHETGWAVYDFKTGDYSAAKSDAEILAPYQLQLGLYALAAEDWLGESIARVGLIVLRPTIRCLEFSWNDAVRERVTQMVDATIRSLRMT